jgi:hypothetical protein
MSVRERPANQRQSEDTERGRGPARHHDLWGSADQITIGKETRRDSFRRRRRGLLLIDKDRHEFERRRPGRKSPTSFLSFRG